MGVLQSAQDNRQSVDQRGSERFDKGCTRARLQSWRGMGL